MEYSKTQIKKILLVCSSCGKESSEGNTSKNLQRRVQRVAKESNEQLMVLLTSCLGVCPDQGTTIGYSSNTASGITVEIISHDLSEELIIQKI